MNLLYNTTFKNLRWRLRKYESIIHEELYDIIAKYADVIIAMITEQQLYRRGIDGHMVRLDKIHPYAAVTIQKKRKKGQVTTRVTLKDTGEFYESFEVYATPDGWYVKGNVPYAEELEEKWGPAIYRLSNENLSKLLTRYIRPELQKRFKQRILYGQNS